MVKHHRVPAVLVQEKKTVSETDLSKATITPFSKSLRQSIANGLVAMDGSEAAFFAVDALEQRA